MHFHMAGLLFPIFNQAEQIWPTGWLLRWLWFPGFSSNQGVDETSPTGPGTPTETAEARVQSGRFQHTQSRGTEPRRIPETVSAARRAFWWDMTPEFLFVLLLVVRRIAGATKRREGLVQHTFRSPQRERSLRGWMFSPGNCTYPVHFQACLEGNYIQGPTPPSPSMERAHCLLGAVGVVCGVSDVLVLSRQPPRKLVLQFLHKEGLGALSMGL